MKVIEKEWWNGENLIIPLHPPILEQNNAL